MTKVAHVLMHSTYNREIAEENMLTGWHVRLARAVDRYTDYEVESWAIDFDVDTSYIERRDGMTCRVFPSTLLPGTRNDVARRIIGSAKHGADFSWRLLQALRAHLKDGGAVHLHGDIYINTYLSGLLPGTKFLHHHGGFRGVPAIERFAFSRFDHLFVLTRNKRAYYTDTVGLSSSAVTVQPMGVDYGTYDDIDVDKADIDLDANFIVMYTGEFSSYKGLDVVLKVYNRLRSTFDIELVLFGGSEDDPLYPTVERTEGVTAFTTYVPDEEYIAYLNASDAYTSFPNAKSLKAGDCGLIAPAEAMACNTPLISRVVKAYPDTFRKQLPFVPSSEKVLEVALKKTLEDEVEGFPWRNVSKPYFSWRSVARRVGNIYDGTID